MTDRQLYRAGFAAWLLVSGAGLPLFGAAPQPQDLDDPAPFEREMNGEPRISPNPADCRKGATAMTFDRLPSLSRVRLYTLQGRLLRELEASPSGAAVWDLCNNRGEPVETGVYLALVTAEGERRAAKVAVQR